MNHHAKIIWGIVLLMACTAACSDDKSDSKENKRGVCTSGESVCRGDDLLVCQDVVWVNTMTCPGGCENGACKTPSDNPVCILEDTKCNERELQVCRDNQWIVDQTCPGACVNGVCVEAKCESKALKCEGDDLLICADNDWVKVMPCPNGCSENACNPVQTHEEEGCQDDARKCEGNDLFACKDKTWSKVVTCQYGCRGDSCNSETPDPPVIIDPEKPDPEPEPGPAESCDINTYVENCQDNVARYCQNGVVTSLPCGDEKICAVRSVDVFAMCTTSCKPGTASTTPTCREYNGTYPYSLTYSCEMAQDGKYAMFANTEWCDYYCSEGKGCDVESGGSTHHNSSTTVGDVCDNTKYVDSCVDNKVYYCDGDRVAATQCDESAPCTVRWTDKHVACAKPCNIGDEPTAPACSIVNDTASSVVYQCERTTTNKYAQFGHVEICSERCTDGKGCTEAPTTPVETGTEIGDPCDETKFVESCQDNKTIHCTNGMITATECGDPNAENAAPCVVRKSDNHSACAKKCWQGTPDYNAECSTYIGKPYSVVMKCELTTEDKYAHFAYVTWCKNTCTQYIGCEDKGEPGSKADIGSSCYSSTYIESCDGNTAIYCSSEVVKSQDCDSQNPCAVRLADNYASCATPCNDGDPDVPTKCTKVNDQVYYNRVYKCQITSDGRYAYFPNTEFCIETCDDKLGCDPCVGDDCNK